ncbi:MAG: phenylacetate-CoA oxygenase subunit PaaI [Chloroflexi bacterium]|nr:phenylacetate-CoA oxygenase subunit PaaI [Chloroflexota bacterium]
MTLEISNPKEFADSTRRALADFILALADTKRFLGIRYAEWCDGAPTLEASVAASAMAQDELGHSRALLPLLKEFPEVDPGIPDEAPRELYASIAFLDQPFSTWPTFVAANVLIGGALTVALEAAQNSCYVPLRTRAVKILQEERFHWLHGESWFKRLAANAKEGIDLANRVEDILPQALCWFGRSEDDRLLHAGILDADNDNLRTRLLNRAGPLIAKSQVGHLMRIEGGHWQYNGGFPWARFDAATRRVEARK